MITLTKTLITLLIIGIGTIPPSLYGAELSASELAQALGVDWWEVRLPGAQSEQFMVSFQLDFGDGRKPFSTGGSNFMGGSKIKVFRQFIPNSDKMYLAVISDKGGPTMSTMPKLFSGMYIGLVSVGSTAKPGEYLCKASKETTGYIESSQSLGPNECALKVVVQKKNEPGSAANSHP